MRLLTTLGAEAMYSQTFSFIWSGFQNSIAILQYLGSRWISKMLRHRPKAFGTTICEPQLLARCSGLSAASYYWTNFCSNLCLDLHQGCQQLRKQGGKREDWIKSVFLPALLYVNVRYKSLMIKNVQQICLFLKAILLTMEMLHCLHCSALVQSDIILHASKVMWTKACQKLYWLLWNYQFVSSRLMIGGSKVI